MSARRHAWASLAVVSLGLFISSGCATAPRFSFDVVADMRCYTPPEHNGPEYFEGACLAIREVGPGAFMLVPGDLDPVHRVHDTVTSTLGDDYAMYPVVGNHELERPEDMPYLREMNTDGVELPRVVRAGPPGAVETCYSFDYENAHFVVINQYYDGKSDAGTDGDVTPALHEWLAEDLAANEQPLVFVAGHEPAVAMPDLDNGRVRHRGDSLDKYAENNHRFWSLLREHDVVGYICGHTHDASVAKINGVWQIDAGHARGLGDKGAPSTFVKIRIDGERVDCEMYRSTAGGPYELTFAERLR